jgi:hypothetical protein
LLIILNPVHHFNLSSFVPLLVQDVVPVVDSFGNYFLVMACAGREGLLDGHPGQEEVTESLFVNDASNGNSVFALHP